MARPKSGNKREAILKAAAIAIAEQGLGASTLSISRKAGVAEGSLFTYFPTKDDLFLHLFFELKREAYGAVEVDFPTRASSKTQAKHFFSRYVDWGVNNQEKRQALANLVISERISEEAKRKADEDSAGYSSVMEQRLASGALQNSHAEFGLAVMHALAEATMKFMTRFPSQADEYRDVGFDAFWRAIGK